MAEGMCLTVFAYLACELLGTGLMRAWEVVAANILMQHEKVISNDTASKLDTRKRVWTMQSLRLLDHLQTPCWVARSDPYPNFTLSQSMPATRLQACQGLVADELSSFSLFAFLGLLSSMACC